MPFCANCGVSVNNSDRFCQQCGAPRVAKVSVPQASPPPPLPPQYIYQQAPTQYACQPQPAPAANPNRVVSALPFAHKATQAGLFDVHTLVFTPYQTLVAKRNKDVEKALSRQSKEQSKAEGKGWLGRVGDQMRASGKAHLRYLSMTPEQILAETPGNYAIDHAAVAAVRIRQREEINTQDVPNTPYAEVEFITATGSYMFGFYNQSPKEVAEILNNFYAGRITR